VEFDYSREVFGDRINWNNLTEAFAEFCCTFQANGV
jgi:hypothetical protein